MKIESGETVTVILQNPREKLFGVLDEINQSGIYIRAIDLNYFDEWANAIKTGESYLPMQEYFLPMWRVEKITKDKSSEEIPSMSEEFERKTGFNLSEFLN